MGNRLNKDLSKEAEQGSSLDDEVGTVCIEENIVVIDHMRKVMQRDSIRVFDRERGLNISVPVIEQVENSTIFNRRKVLSEISLQSTSAGSVPRKPKTRHSSSKLRRIGRPNLLVPSLHYLEELESPTLLHDMMEYTFSNSLSRLNY